MVKSSAQILEPPADLPGLAFQKKSAVDFSVKSETAETSVVKKNLEKLNDKFRFDRLKKRKRNRSSNIL